MRRHKRRRNRHSKNKVSKIGVLFIILILSLATVSVSYAHWEEKLEIKGEMQTTEWGSCIKIRKTLYEGCRGVCNKCYDEYTMKIEVMNNGTSDLTDVNVTDTIGSQCKILWKYEPHVGEFGQPTEFDFYWDIGDLASEETVTLDLCIGVKPWWCCDWDSAYVVSPEDGAFYDVTRVYPDGTTEIITYEVEHHGNHRRIKFQDPEPSQLGDYGIATETFVIEVEDGTNVVQVQTKAGQGCPYNILEGVTDSVLDSNGFLITLVSIEDLSNGNQLYTISIYGPEEGFKSLSHIEFDFGKTCEKVVNYGATVTADGGFCDLLAFTDGISFYKHKFYRYPTCVPKDGYWFYYYPSIEFPVSTSWAWDCCGSLCEDC